MNACGANRVYCHAMVSYASCVLSFGACVGPVCGVQRTLSWSLVCLIKSGGSACMAMNVGAGLSRQFLNMDSSLAGFGLVSA